MTTDLMIVRSVQSDLEILSRAKGGDGRTIVGIAVPYDVVTDIPTEGIREMFLRGAFNAQLNAPNRIDLARGHQAHGGSLIGRGIEMRDDAAGLWVAMRASATPLGDETLTMIEDGTLPELSVGFREGTNRRMANGVTGRVTAHLREVAVVREGQYGANAAILALRAAGQSSATPLLDQARALTGGFRLLPLP